MGSFSIWHLLIIVVIVVSYIWPVSRLLHRTGHARFWVILGFIPLVNVIALWVWAYKPWPPARN